ncbi:hypothetical protein BS50DRAFT_478426 [Corynespora cassiicola Philippines]|uniref:Uncharacterized protein n=1 Tax=Corynespora cassiicola Philippines TaxID=1448308 RepID=A0A2T2PBN7_CORCC|nr:hypothetical protein BS50DRAFT_478426 [Corynespora cassiicola Philippines]
MLQFSKSDFDTDKMLVHRIPHEGCPSTTASETRHYEFNVTHERTGKNWWYFRDHFDPKWRKNLRGLITIDQGNYNQTSDIEVHVIISSNDERDLENLKSFKSSVDPAMELDYNFEDIDGLCTEVEVRILLRSWYSRSLPCWGIDTSILDIEYLAEYIWEVDTFEAHITYGYFYMEWQNNSIVAHNISVSSQYGTMTGWWFLDQYLQLNNKEGGIGVFLFPRHPGHPFDLKGISLINESGEIFVRYAMAYWPMRSFAHETTIKTTSGDIFAWIPHGKKTDISSTGGNIDVSMVAYSDTALGMANEIYTRSITGDIYLYLDSSQPESFGEYPNPLLNTSGRHTVSEGKLRVSYAPQWWGVMEVRIEKGTLELNGSHLENVNVGEGYVKAKRGKIGTFYTKADVGTGSIYIDLSQEK